MGHHTDAGRVHSAGQDFSLIELFYELRRPKPRSTYVEDYDIGLNCFWIDLNPRNLREPLRQELRVFMIHGQKFRSLFERDQTRRGQHPNLPHAAPKRLTNDPAAFDEIFRANDHGAYGRSQSFA